MWGEQEHLGLSCRMAMGRARPRVNRTCDCSWVEEEDREREESDRTPDAWLGAASESESGIGGIHWSNGVRLTHRGRVPEIPNPQLDNICVQSQCDHS